MSPLTPIARVLGDQAARRPPVTGGLAKALLIDTSSGVVFPVMYNPQELKIEQGNNFAEVGIPGLNAPPLQYVRGKSRVLTMELFFDTYETHQDVRQYTTPIVRLLDRQPQTQAPPVLLFSFGRMQFRCVLVDAAQRYTMFARDGTPVRSTMSVRLQEYVDVQVQVRQGVFFGSPTLTAATDIAVAGAQQAVSSVSTGSTTIHVTVRGDTLSGIAAAYLGDPMHWRLIAEANKIDDPLTVPPGTSLLIPSPSAAGR
jgi:nucleoid-associated protein YgaU